MNTSKTQDLIDAIRSAGDRDNHAQRNVYTALGGQARADASWPSVAGFHVSASGNGAMSVFALTTSGLLALCDFDAQGNLRKKTTKVRRVRQVIEEQVGDRLNVVVELDAGASIVEQFSPGENDVPELTSAGTLKAHMWLLRAKVDTDEYRQVLAFADAVRNAMSG